MYRTITLRRWGNRPDARLCVIEGRAYSFMCVLDRWLLAHSDRMAYVGAWGCN